MDRHARRSWNWHTVAASGVLLLASLTAAAQTAEPPLARLAELLRDGQAGAAYALAAELRATHEGDPGFDLLYGLAALDTGHPDEAVFALERVLFERPDDVRARLALARGYFLLGEDAHARGEFEALLAEAPPAAVAAAIEGYLDALTAREARYRPQLRGHIGLAAGYDSNVNGATDAAGFTSPLLGPLALADASREAGAWFSALRAGAHYNRPLRAGLDAFLGGALERRWLGDHSAFARGLYTLDGGLRRTAGRDTYTLSLLYQHYRLGGARYRDLAGVTGEWRHALGEAMQAGAYLHAATLRYPEQPLRDADLGIAGALLVRVLDGAWRPRLQAGLYGGVERARNGGDAAASLAERDILGAQATLELRPSPALALHGGLAWQASRYAAVNAFLGVRREDDFYRVELGATRRLAPGWRVALDASYARSRSNSVLYDTSRWQIEASLRHEFD